MDENPETETAAAGGGLINLLTPEGLIMMGVALMLDLAGVIILFFALDDFGVLDILGILSIGLWLFFRSGGQITSPAPQSSKKKAEKASKQAAEKAADVAKTAEKVASKAGKYGRWLKPLICTLGELVPYLGVLPWWTYAVYSELTSNK